MKNIPAIHMEQLFKEAIETNRKLVKSMEILMNLPDIDVGTTPKELVYQEDRMKLFHYQPMVEELCPVPLLIIYALVNRQYMMDLQPDRSLIRNLLEHGHDVYIIDWGYPMPSDRYITMDDYIERYIGNVVDIIREKNKIEKINLLGVCQGGTFSVIYSALHPEKIRNLVTMVTPIDFDTEDGLLNIWAKELPIDNIVDTLGIIPGDMLNIGFLMLKPLQLTLDKYISLTDAYERKEIVENFIRMEKWIFDSPDQAGEAIRQFVNDLYKKNLLIQNKLVINGKRVNLKKINMPLLNIYAEQDHLVPPSSTKPLNDAVSSKDKTLFAFPGGHIGIYVSSRSQKEMAPAISKWLTQRSQTLKKLTPNQRKRSKK